MTPRTITLGSGTRLQVRHIIAYSLAEPWGSQGGLAIEFLTTAGPDTIYRHVLPDRIDPARALAVIDAFMTGGTGNGGLTL